jgi:hypothetical protein
MNLVMVGNTMCSLLMEHLQFLLEQMTFNML